MCDQTTKFLLMSSDRNFGDGWADCVSLEMNERLSSLKGNENSDTK